MRTGHDGRRPQPQPDGGLVRQQLRLQGPLLRRGVLRRRRERHPGLRLRECSRAASPTAAGVLRTNTLILVQDSIKLDGCGIEEDVALWSEMFNHSIRLLQAGGDKEKKGMMIENCHSARSHSAPSRPWRLLC